LNETLLTKPADISGYAPLDLAGGTGYRFGRIGTKRRLPVSTRTGLSEPATPLS